MPDTTSSPHAKTLLILSLVIPLSAAVVFGVLALVVPVDAKPPDTALIFLIGAVVTGILGPGVGKMLRGRLAEPADFDAFVRQSTAPTLVGLAIREGAVILAGLYVHLGGQLPRGAAVAGIIVLTMLLDARTPGRLRAEYEAMVGRRG